MYFCSVPTPLDILSQYWGYDAFRRGQEEIIQDVIAGKDVLAMLPTGGGKSICFQVPALAMDRLCVVISPLMALMNDQVQQLKQRGISAYALHSAMSRREQDRILDMCIYQPVHFLYVSPERLQSELFKERFKKMKLSLIAIDEAHCVSQWGVDFRPEYLQIGDIRSIHPDVPMIALTASATPEMISDIEDKLQMRQPIRHIQSFARKNLSYNVNYTEDKFSKLIELCHFFQGSGIIYCRTRGRTQEVQRGLERAGIAAAFYHAGLTHAQREKTFAAWSSGKARVMCATNAFGMGIDKSDVRFVLHVDMPLQPESYFQEVGRAGRDGKTAYGVLLWNERDISEAKLTLMRQFPTREAVRAIYRQLTSFLQIAPGAGMLESYPFSIAVFAQRYQSQPMDVLAALNLLKLAGYIRLDDGAYRPSKIHVLMNKNGLYNFQVMHPHWDNFVTLLLRMYGGLFEQYVPIRELEIARLTNLSVESVVDKLKKLQQMDVIEYIPQMDSPMLTLLTGCLHEDEIRIPRDLMEERMDREQKRLDTMIHFLQSPICRSHQLLRYFGENPEARCGICDVCRAEKKSLDTRENRQQYSVQLRDYLQRQSLSDDELHKAFAHVDSNWLIEQIRMLADEGFIERDDAERWHWKANA